MRILFTGGTGFIGRNIIPILKKKYNIYSPNRTELNLLDTNVVSEYIIQKKIDIVIHAAIPNLLPGKDDPATILKSSLTAFMNLYSLRNHYKKMIYFGSGAEYDKSLDISYVTETQIGINIPKSDYGFAKYIMNALARGSQNIYNLRIFGCYGPTDADFKLITSAILSCIKGEDIKIRQNTWFDFMYVEDIVPILDYFINHTPKYHDYNMCTGNRIQNVEVCQIVSELTGSHCKVLVSEKNNGKEYTACNKRLLNEIPDIQFTDIKDGIKKQIDFERNKMQ